MCVCVCVCVCVCACVCVCVRARVRMHMCVLYTLWGYLGNRELAEVVIPTYYYTAYVVYSGGNLQLLSNLAYS